MRSTVDFAFRVRVGRGVLIIIFISRADHHASLRILLGSYVELNLTCLLCCFFPVFFPSPFISGLFLLLETCRLERLAIVISRYGYNDTLRVISL